MTWHLRHTVWLWCNFPHGFLLHSRVVTYFSTNFYGFHPDSATVIRIHLYYHVDYGVHLTWKMKASMLLKLRDRDGLITVMMLLIIAIIIYFCTLLWNVGKVFRIRKIYKYFIKMCDSMCFQFSLPPHSLADLIFFSLLFLISYLFIYLFF